MIKLLHPEFIWIALSVVGASFALLLGRRLRARTLEVLFRLSAITLLSLALLQPYIVKVSDKTRATVLLDISESMNEASSEQLLNKVASLKSENLELNVFPFAGNISQFSVDIEPSSNYRSIRNSWNKLNIGETNIEQALSRAFSLDSENILLVSDGWETKGRKDLLLTTRTDKKIFPLALDLKNQVEKNFELAKLHAPLIAPAEKSVEIRATIANSTSKSQSGLLEIKHDGKIVQKQTVTVESGKEIVIKANSDPSKEGIKEVVATFTPVDPRIPSSTKTIYISGEKREKVLIVSGTAQDEYLLSTALSSQSYKVQNITAPNRNVSFPDSSDFSAILLNNVAISQLPDNFPSKLEEYVKNGGSAVMIGGNQSFGLGGYIGSPIERMLPVEMLPPQTMKKRLNVAVSLVLDKSRSMATEDKIYYAKQAASEVIRSLKDDDFIEIIGFDSSPFVVVKLSRLAEVRATALDRVNRIFPAGRTNLLPAMHEARRSFAKIEAGRKHMIILTDGRVPDAGPYYMELVNQLRSDGVTISTVLLGDEADPLLRDMARQGGGAFHQTVNAQSLAKIFLNDIRVSTGERTLKEDVEYAVKKGTGLLRSTSIETYPPLKGYVQTKAKEPATLELITYANEKGDPLLVSWDYGKGKSIAFTSDANGRWSSFWAGWSKYAEFWSEIVESLRPSQGVKNQAIKFDLRYFVENGALVLDLSLYSDGVSGAVSAILLTPKKEERKIAFEQTAPGRFIAKVDEIIAGKYELKSSVGGKALSPVAFYLSGDLFGEKMDRGFNLEVLQSLAEATGGKINPSAQELTATGNKVTTKLDLSYYLIALGVICLLLEILQREGGTLLSWRKNAP